MVYLQMTWAYEHGCPRVFEVTGGRDSDYMLDGIRKAYKRAKDKIGADGIIPSGELMELLYQHGASKIYRDTFHASFGAGRYTLALTWFVKLFGKSCIGNGFRGFDEEIDENTVALCQKIADSVVSFDKE